MTSYYVPRGGLPAQTELTTDRARVHRGLRGAAARHDARHRHQLPAVLGRHPAVGDRATAVRLRRDVLAVHRRGLAPGGGSDRPEPDPDAEAVLFVVDGTRARSRSTGVAHALDAGRLRLPPARRSTWTLRNRGDRPGHVPLDPQGLPARRRASTLPEAFVTNERDDRAGRRCPTPTARGQRRGSSTRPTCATTCTSTSSPSQPGGVDPVRRDPRDGARAVRARGQGGVPAQPGLGRGGGGRLHVAARLLPAGLLRRRAGPVPLPALQGRQPARSAQPRGFA